MAKANKTKTNWVVVSIIAAAILVIGGGIIWYCMEHSKITVSENQTSVEVKKGQEFTIKLTSNASTGYSWAVDDAYDKNVVTKVSNSYKAAKTDRSGAPGEELWVFKGKNTGSTKLSFKYAQPWEGSTGQVSTKTFNVTVK